MDVSGHQDLQAYADQAQYLGVDDVLALTAISNTANVVVTFSGRLLRRDGVIIPVTTTLQLAAARTAVTAYWQPAQGFLLGLVAVSSSGAANGCYTYVKADLTRGVAGKNAVFQSLMAGYVDVNFAFGYPMSPPQRPTDGPGTLVLITVANPAAGAEISYTVPAGCKQQLLGASITLTTSSGAGNRTASVYMQVGGTTVYYQQAGTPQAPSTAISYSISPGAQNQAPSGSNVIIGVPDVVILSGGANLQTSTVGLLAGDQYSAIAMVALEWAAMR